MTQNLTQKIIAAHLVAGEMTAGTPVQIRIDQTLTQDATGTLAWLQFEAMGLDRVKVETAVSYIDHNTLQTDFRNPDDHVYLQTVAARYGAWFSKPGNGICHQVHLERFAKPGAIQLGSDSHTPTAGGVGAIAIGVGGLDIAVTMAGEPFNLRMPSVLGVELTGELPRPWVAAMDVIMEILRRLTVKGGVNKVVEYYGPGVATLSVTERATITNMGAELGATTSIFPSDERTRAYLKAQGREDDYEPLAADEGCEYDEHLEINLSELEPLVCQPWSPGDVVAVRDVLGKKVAQVCIGSCTNSSFPVMRAVADILRGRTVAERCSLTINPGSKQVYTMLARDGSTAAMIDAGARLLESACGPCIGMGQTPPTDSISVRSFNRNFRGRCGDKSVAVYLANPLVCAAMALAGEIVDPRESGIEFTLAGDVEQYEIRDNLLLAPRSDQEAKQIEVVRGPNIKPVPVAQPPDDQMDLPVALVTGDNISTDDIMPAGAKVLPLRSNIPAISEYVYRNTDAEFVDRVRDVPAFVIIGGENYGQGSSREHAAIAPMYLGLRAVIVKSFARIHRTNLINFGVLPLTFADPADYDRLQLRDDLRLCDVAAALPAGGRLKVKNVTQDYEFDVALSLQGQEGTVLQSGGLLSLIKSKQDTRR